MDSYNNAIMYYDHPSNFSNFKFQNIRCNFNIIQTGNDFHYKNADISYEYPYVINNNPVMGAPFYQQYPMKNNFSNMHQSQPLTETHPIAYNSYNYQNFQNPSINYSANEGRNVVKIEDCIDYNKANMISQYEGAQNFSNINYNNNFLSQNVCGNSESYPLQSFPQEMYPTVQEGQLNGELQKVPNVRKMHPNCTTLVYNRKSASTANVPRKFYCTYTNCFKAYMKSSHLKAHMRIHSGEKPHICKFIFEDKTVCTESFSRSDQLTRHRRKHTNDRPFRCLYCDKSFFRSDHCNTHQKRCRRNSDKIQKSFY